MSPTQIKPRPEIYRLAAQIMEEKEHLVASDALQVATHRVMSKASLDRREAVYSMHRRQFVAMFTCLPSLARYALHCVGNVHDQAAIENEQFDKEILKFAPPQTARQQRVTALLLMADIVESPNN